MSFSPKSLTKLIGVHPRLVSVIGAASAICPIRFEISEGVRSKARQKYLVETHKSQTMFSKHLPQKDGFSHACDVVVINDDGTANWHFENYRRVADSVKIASLQLNIPVIWGGDWNTLKDGPHFQLKD